MSNETPAQRAAEKVVLLRHKNEVDECAAIIDEALSNQRLEIGLRFMTAVNICKEVYLLLSHWDFDAIEKHGGLLKSDVARLKDIQQRALDASALEVEIGETDDE